MFPRMAESDCLTYIFPAVRTPEVFHQLDNYSISIKRFFQHPNFSCLNYENFTCPKRCNHAILLCSNVTRNMFICRLFSRDEYRFGRRLSWLTNFCRNAVDKFISVKQLIGSRLSDY